MHVLILYCIVACFVIHFFCFAQHLHAGIEKLCAAARPPAYVVQRERRSHKQTSGPPMAMNLTFKDERKLSYRGNANMSMNLLHSGDFWGNWKMGVRPSRVFKSCRNRRRRVCTSLCIKCVHRLCSTRVFLLPVLVCGHLVELISLLTVSYLLSQDCLLKQYHPPEQHTHTHTLVTYACVFL